MSKKERIGRILGIFKEFGITGYEIAKSCPVTETGVNKIINGKISNPNESTLQILENYLLNKHNINLNWLKRGEGIKVLPNIPTEAAYDEKNEDERQKIIKDLSIFVAYHKKDFFKDEVFKSMVEQKAYEMVIELMKEDSQK